jgi:hydroxymethylpyrimidine pyrophosphatase-like HAD family hydrolase
MRYDILACDYDGTLAHHGVVGEPVIGALERFRGSGRRLVMVTGRVLCELSIVFSRFDLFDCIVAENGATLFFPAAPPEIPLAPSPPAEFVERLQRRGVVPLSVGQVVVATLTEHEPTVLRTIRELGLALDAIRNKESLMVLPAGVDKATGLAAALSRMGTPSHRVVAVGDAENDLALFGGAAVGVAVANAVPALAQRADLVTANRHGEGVMELIDRILATDLAELDRRN